MPDQLQPIVQRMIDAGESEENIATVIQHFKSQASTPQPLIGHALTASDETPTATDRFVNGFVDNPLIQGAAHPQTVQDFTSLLLPEVPSMVVRGAVAAGRAAKPYVAPLMRGAAEVIDNVPGVAKKLLPFKTDAVVGRLRTIADSARDSSMGITRGATPPSQFQRSSDSTARALEPIAEVESLPVPSHLDMSRQVRPSQLTPQQMAEREGAAYAREIQGGTPTQTGSIRTTSLREKFPQGLPREMPAPIEPMPSHGPSVGASMLENAEARAKQILPDVPPASGRVPTGHGSQPDNLLETLPDEPVASAMPAVDQQAAVRDGLAERMAGGTEAAGQPVKSAADWVREMNDLRETKPRPISKVYGSKGPTPQQAEEYAARTREWNRAYREASKQQKIALERDNAAFAARQQQAPQPSEMQQPRVDIGAERVGRAQGLTKEQVRAQTAPILGEAQGAASPILPQKALNNIVDAIKALPKEGGAREAYVQAATSGKAQWQVETVRRTLERLGLIVPAAAAISPDVRGMLLDRMRSGVTGRDSQ